MKEISLCHETGHETDRILYDISVTGIGRRAADLFQRSSSGLQTDSRRNHFPPEDSEERDRKTFEERDERLGGKAGFVFLSVTLNQISETIL